MKKHVRIIACLMVCVLLLLSFASCGQSGAPIMSLADKNLSVNVYELLLCRMKGTLASYGYKVSEESFWRTVISADGMTYDEYFSTAILEEASRYLISDYLFDRNGLILDEETEKQIDEMLDKMIEHAGSKTALNEILKNYGVNLEMLREVYVIEAKTALLKEHLYGKKGEKIDASVKEEYLQEHYVGFGQIFLASYYYLTDTDTFGDPVYYTDDKHKAIAYDKEKGETETDEFGKIITDIFGDPVYYSKDGKIAYDKKNGVIGYVLDKDGDKTPMTYEKEVLAELYEKAEAYKTACNGDIDVFAEYAELYDESDLEGTHNYLYAGADYYGAQDESYAYLDEIAEALKKMEVGQTALIESDYGYHVVCKYEIEPGIYESEEQKEVFADFTDGIINMLFAALCTEYEDAITIHTDAYEAAPAMSQVAVNTLY